MYKPKKKPKKPKKCVYTDCQNEPFKMVVLEKPNADLDIIYVCKEHVDSLQSYATSLGHPIHDWTKTKPGSN